MHLLVLAASLTTTVCTVASAQDTSVPAAPAAESDADTGEREAKNALHFELLGPAVIYSLNYERWFADDFSGRVGFSYFSLEATAGEDSAKASLLMVPLSVSYLGIGTPNHMLELGAGAVITHASAGVEIGGSKSEGAATTAWGTAIVGYRYQPEDGGFMFRVGASPLISDDGVFTWPHLSLGGAF
jgi:hypothetical protein